MVIRSPQASEHHPLAIGEDIHRVLEDHQTEDIHLDPEQPRVSKRAVKMGIVS